MSSDSIHSHVNHTPDYIVIGQMLDNPEKVPFTEEDEARNYVVNPLNGAMSDVSISPLTPLSQGRDPFYHQLPQYTSPIASTSHLESSNLINPTNISSPAGMSSTSTETGTRGLIGRITIPTTNETLSSGFPYDPKVYDLISHDEWYDLSSDIVSASKVTFGENWGAWATGITTGTLSSAFIMVFGPVAGYYAGRAVHRKTVLKVAKERLERDGGIRSVLRQWNAETFQQRGFQVWLELPIDGAELKEPTVKDKQTDSKRAKALKAQKKMQQAIDRRFKIVLIPNPAGSKILLGQDNFCESPLNTAEHPIVEAMGNELKDPVELDPTRDPAELQEISSITEPENQTKESPVVTMKREEIMTKISAEKQPDRTLSIHQIEQLAPVELDASPGYQSAPSSSNLLPRQKEQIGND